MSKLELVRESTLSDHEMQAIKSAESDLSLYQTSSCITTARLYGVLGRLCSAAMYDHALGVRELAKVTCLSTRRISQAVNAHRYCDPDDPEGETVESAVQRWVNDGEKPSFSAWFDAMVSRHGSSHRPPRPFDPGRVVEYVKKTCHSDPELLRQVAERLLEQASAYNSAQAS